MIQLSYVSHAVEPFTSDALKALVNKSRTYNAARGITGMLLYVDSTFVQVLEGEESEVDSLLDLIGNDPRHEDIRVIERRRITEREFPNWKMGLQEVSLDELRSVSGLRELADRGLDPDYLQRNSTIVPVLMNHIRRERLNLLGQEELSVNEPDRLIQQLNLMIRGAVRVLAVLMVLAIFWGVVDVVYVLYAKVLVPSVQEFRAQDIIVTFGAFLTVLIAIEIFLNITLYLRDDVIHIRLVISTALMAIARKVIIIDFETVTPLYLFGTAAVVLALGITYWLVGHRTMFGRSPSVSRMPG